MKKNFYLFLELNGILLNPPTLNKTGTYLNFRSVKALNILLYELNQKYNVNLRLITNQVNLLQNKSFLQNNGVDFSLVHSFLNLPKYILQKREFILSLDPKKNNFAIIDNGLEFYPIKINAKNVIYTSKKTGLLEEHNVNEFLDCINLNSNAPSLSSSDCPEF